MKTPDQFIQIITDQKNDPGRKAKRRMPRVIVVTLIFAMLMVLSGGSGLVRVILSIGMVLQGEVSVLSLAFGLGRQLAIVSLALATIFACLKRPSWGRVVSTVFAVFFSLVVIIVLIGPSTHPVFQIASGAEQAGAYAAAALMAFGIAVYAWSMTLGSKARAYFTGA